MKTNQLIYQDLITLGSLIALTGFVFSGPPALLIVNLVKPQPGWSSGAVFAENYHIIQDLPYYFGFLLISGMLMLSVSHYLNFNDDNPKTNFYLLLALGWTIVFCALVSFNYICQTTFVRHLALNYRSEHDAAISIFSMANPLSFCWANEMWAYAFLGIATFCMAGYYEHTSKPISILLISNGIVSVGSAIWTIADIQWVLTTFGLVGYSIWNALMIAILLLIYNKSRRVAKHGKH